jgi:hypothetical protein
MAFTNDLRRVVVDTGRLLIFRPVALDMQRLGNLYLALGLLATWAAGIGRYWDNPRAQLWQQLGLGSVGYVFVLALILWLFILPLKPKNWSYRNVLTFVTLTSPPALLYAIPVERFMALDTAASVNVGFLVVVALWRVVLLILFLKRAAGLSKYTLVVASLLPLVLIVTSLAILNMEHVIFRLMGGLRPGEKTANDTSYYVLLLITVLSNFLTPVLIVSYGVLIAMKRKRVTKSESGEDHLG